MAMLHADLVGPLAAGQNSQNQRSFRYILSVVDSATCYLWLLSLHHKTTEAVAAALFDEVISRVSVPSTIMMYDEKSLAPLIYHGNLKVPDSG